MTNEEIEAGVQRWYQLCDTADEDWDQSVDEYLGISKEEFDIWRDARDAIIEIGYDIDGLEIQRVHVVLGAGHFDKYPLCGATTLWGYHHGTKREVTCPQCLEALKDFK
jgi:hypothetical protein